MNILASNMINFLSKPSPERTKLLSEIYGRTTDEKLDLYINTLKQFIEIFGDQPIVIVRAPGRVNLRGMHIDTHGGFLNLMSLNREIIVVASPSTDGFLRIYNFNPTYQPLITSIKDSLNSVNDHLLLTNGKPYSGRWEEDTLDLPSNHWHRYILGSILQLCKEIGSSSITGINAVINSDIPEGCSLSSSHALCISILLTLETFNSVNLDLITKIKLVQKAEWFAGARSGLSDQIAELMCKREHILGVQIDPSTAEILQEEHIPLPHQISVIVANSNQKRNISSTHSVEYVKNRFAYSLAIDLLKKTMPDFGFTKDQIESFKTFNDFTLDKIGGSEVLYEMFRQLPLSIPIEEVNTLIGSQKLDELYNIYFAHLPESSRPKELNIRGVVIYGICENLRAKAFFDAIKAR